MIRSCTLALIALSSLLASESTIPQTDRSGRYSLNAVWIEAGMGPGVTDGDVTGLAIGSGGYNQSLDSDWRPGMHAAIEVTHARLELDGEGWTMGVGLWYDQAPGRITAASTPTGPAAVDEDLKLEIMSVAVLPAWTHRFDSDELARVAARDWQFDVGPVLALGVARAQIGDGDKSRPGFAWQAGARLRLHGEIAHNLRAGFYAGGVWLDARAEWENTGPSSFRGFSPIAGLILGYEL